MPHSHTSSCLDRNVYYCTSPTTSPSETPASSTPPTPLMPSTPAPPNTPMTAASTGVSTSITNPSTPTTILTPTTTDTEVLTKINPPTITNTDQPLYTISPHPSSPHILLITYTHAPPNSPNTIQLGASTLWKWALTHHSSQSTLMNTRAVFITKLEALEQEEIDLSNMTGIGGMERGVIRARISEETRKIMAFLEGNTGELIELVDSTSGPPGEVEVLGQERMREGTWGDLFFGAGVFLVGVGVVYRLVWRR